MYELPTKITIADKDYPIRNNGDFRMVLDCFECLQDEKLEHKYRILSAMIIFYDGMNSVEDVVNTFGDNLVEAVNQMNIFFNCGQVESVGATQPHKLIDWKQDEQLVISAINNVANREIRLDPFVHWWTFVGYYLAIGDCALATVVSIRNKILKGKKLESWERDFKNNNPNYFVWNHQTIEEQEMEEYVRNLWNSNSQS